MWEEVACKTQFGQKEEAGRILLLVLFRLPERSDVNRLSGMAATDCVPRRGGETDKEVKISGVLWVMDEGGSDLSSTKPFQVMGEDTDRLDYEFNSTA